MDQKTRTEIEKITKKVLLEAGIKEPPFQDETILAHLNLHRDYYDLEDPSLVAEIKHALKIGVNRFVGMLRKIHFVAATIPDQKRIFIDKSVHGQKQKWATLHEATHNILPWHKAFYAFVDTAETLEPDFQEQLEQEANYGAKQLLFIGDSFKNLALESQPSLKAAKDLKHLYETSWESTLRNYVENTHNAPMMLIVCSPWWEKDKPQLARGWRYFVRSSMCRTMFPNLHTDMILRSFDRTRMSVAAIDFMDPILIPVTDIAGNRHQFTVELLYNGYDVLILALPNKPLATSVLISKKVV